MENNQNNNLQSNMTKSLKLFKIVSILLILILIGISGFFAYSWQQEKDKVEKLKIAAATTKEMVDIVNKDVYRQFELVDQRGHWAVGEVCIQLAVNTSEDKPEYVRLVENGTCHAQSDVYKPNYSAFTPALQDKASSINNIYSEFGIDNIASFDDKDTKNYLYDTCNGLIEVGECDIETSF